MFIWFAAALAQDLAPGEVLPDAVAIQLTPSGLASIGDLVGAVLPSEPLAVDPISAGNSCFGADIENVRVAVDVQGTSVVAGQGTLNINLAALLSINDPQNPLIIDYEIACFGGDCPGYVDPFLVTIDLPISLSVDPTTGLLDAEIAPLGPSNFSNALVEDDIHLDCAIDTINDIASALGLSIYDQVIDVANDFLIDEINSQADSIEAEIEGAFNAASIQESIELTSGVNLEVSLAPRDIVVSPEGVQLMMEGAFSAPASPCIADFDPGASAGTSGVVPPLAGQPPGSELVIHASDDLINQALYSVWRSGLLCQEFGDGALGPLSIDTALLGLIGGEAYEELFPETKPLTVKTLPKRVLEADFLGAGDLDVQVRDLDVVFFAELDGRQARVLGVELDADVGVDLNFDPTTGELGVDVGLDPDVGVVLTGDIMVLGNEDEVAENVGMVLGALLDTVLGGLVGNTLTFGLPVLDGGIGLSSLETTPTGAGTWLGLYASIGPVAYQGGSCEDGCSGGVGCASADGPAFGFASLMVLLLRRRR